jgi:hypothetical protein
LQDALKKEPSKNGCIAFLAKPSLSKPRRGLGIKSYLPQEQEGFSLILTLQRHKPHFYQETVTGKTNLNRQVFSSDSCAHFEPFSMRTTKIFTAQGSIKVGENNLK